MDVNSVMAHLIALLIGALAGIGLGQCIYFEDYKGGTVQIVCNETEEVVYEEAVK